MEHLIYGGVMLLLFVTWLILYILSKRRYKKLITHLLAEKMKLQDTIEKMRNNQ